MNGSKVLWFIEGIILIVLGFIVMVQPVDTVLALGIFFAWFLMIIGIIEIVLGFSSYAQHHRVLYIVEGIILLVLGFFLLFKSPLFAEEVLVYMTMFGLIILSVTQLFTSSNVRGGWRYFIYVIDIIVIVACIYALFNPLYAEELFIYIIVFDLYLLGLSRIFMIFSNNNDDGDDSNPKIV